MSGKKQVPRGRSAPSPRSRRSEAEHRSTPYGAARLLVAFLNAESADLSEPERKLQAAMRELCDHLLEDRTKWEGDRRFGLHRLNDDPMNIIWSWCEEHPCVLNLMGWDRASYIPPQSVYRPVDERTEDRQGSLAAFALWLLLLLADRHTYRAGRGFVFHSTTGHRMRLLKCAVCKAFFIRSAGRVAPEQNACEQCQLPRKRGPRAGETVRKKVQRRVEHLQRAWRENPWSPKAAPDIYWEPRGDRPTFEVFSFHDALRVSIFGGAETHERVLMQTAIGEFTRALRRSGGR